MRLIDADALKRYIPTRMDMQDLYLPVHFKTLIDEQPTVDAVPREELFNLFVTITSAEYGKQRFFAQKDGTVYDRQKGDYLHNFDLAVVRFCNELSDY